MRTRTLTIVGMLALLVMVLTTATAAADNRTPFSGQQYWGPEGEPERYWEPGNNAFFWRDYTFTFYILSNDPRYQGTMLVNHNGNYWLAPSSPIGAVGQTWGTFRIEADWDLVFGNCPDYWEGTFTGDVAADGREVIKSRAKGYGAYAGLQLRSTSSTLHTVDVYYTVEGEILDPGK